MTYSKDDTFFTTPSAGAFLKEIGDKYGPFPKTEKKVKRKTTRKTTRKPRRTVMTYRAPFVEESGMVTDAMGYVIAQYGDNEMILIGGSPCKASEAVAKALNAYVKAESAGKGAKRKL